MTRALIAFILTVVTVVGLSYPAHAACDDVPAVAVPAEQRRVALVIGNSDYKDVTWPDLNNALNDANAVCQAMKDVGFEVIRVVEADRQEMTDGLQRFKTRADGADTALVYFAGHGFEYDGKAWLVPVNAPARTTRAGLEQSFFRLDELLAATNGAKNARLMFLDACRTPDPIVTLTDGDGRVYNDFSDPADWEGFIFYSAMRQQPAYDAAPRHAGLSPFAYAVVEAMQSDQDITFFFRQVARDVKRATDKSLGADVDGGIQKPNFNDTLLREFSMVDQNVMAAAIAAREMERRRAEENERAAGEIAPVRPRTLPPPSATVRPPVPGSTIGGTAPQVVSNQTDRMRNQAAPVAAAAPMSASRDLANALEQLTLPVLAVTDEPEIVGDLMKVTTLAELTAAAADGNVTAQYLLGYMHHLGDGAPRNLALAKRWLEQAATSNHPAAQLELAYFEMKNNQTPAGRARALELMEASAAQGFAKGQAHLGFSLQQNTLGVEDKPRAAQLFAAAAQVDYPYAIYAKGYFGDDYDGAAGRLKTLADRNNASATDWYCQLRYEDDREAGRIDAAGYLRYCQSAAYDGFSASMAVTALLLGQATTDPDSDPDRRRTTLFWLGRAIDRPDLEPGYCSQLLSLRSGLGLPPLKEPRTGALRNPRCMQAI